MDKNDKREMVFGVVFGLVVVIATILEMIFNGITPGGVFGAIKDIAGTLVVFVVLFAYISEHKKVKGLRGSIESRMKEIEKKYNPLIREAVSTENSSDAKRAKLEKVIRYEIAKDSDAIYRKQYEQQYVTFFDINTDKPDKVEFYIRKLFFGESDTKPFDADKIARNLQAYMYKRYQECNTQFVPDNSGGKFIVQFDDALVDKAQIDQLMCIIDDMIFIYGLEKKA